jgi:hypothetical protein
VLPGPVPYPTTSPPLVGSGALPPGYLTPGLHVASTERVRVGVDVNGRPAAVSVRQRLVVQGKGDYQLAVGAPLVDVRRGPGSESEPGFRVDQLLWAGFSPGRKVLTADVVLKRLPAAPYLPLRLRVRRSAEGATLTVTNVTTTPELEYAGVVRTPEIARLLDDTRRASLAGVRLRGAFATFRGPVRTPKSPLVIEAPFRVWGELRLREGSALVLFSRVLGDGRPLSFTVRARGSGTPVVHLRAAPAPVVRLLKPPGAPTWATAVRRRRLEPAFLLRRLLETRMRLVRADQFQMFIADPDADGRTRAVYEYDTVAAKAPPRSVAAAGGGEGSNVLLIVLAVVGSVVAVGGGLVVWAHS